MATMMVVGLSTVTVLTTIRHGSTNRGETNRGESLWNLVMSCNSEPTSIMLLASVHRHGSDDDSRRFHKSWWILVKPSNVVEESVMIPGESWCSENDHERSKQSWRSYGLKWAWPIRWVTVSQSCIFVLRTCTHSHSWPFLGNSG